MTQKLVQCAIYTRKSSEEGLDQDYNSLDAQRDACSAYIDSQKGQGWKVHPGRFDDGGISGGTMERPGLKELLRLVERGEVEVIVVYKIDRLTRSLADFARIVETLDKHNASFVSVTQQFNTTTSMGRLTLTVLLSFAQFEREVTSERIRDKIAASKRKGLWMGGHPPLGYDILNRRLAPNAKEAEIVKLIFETALEARSLSRLQVELKEMGVRSKSWRTQKRQASRRQCPRSQHARQDFAQSCIHWKSQIWRKAL
jgi:DNA invertase Pin-like site-specific DNA recombinase